MNLNRTIKESLRKILDEEGILPVYSNADAIWLNYAQVLSRLANFANNRYKKAHLQRGGKPISMSEVLNLREMIRQLYTFRHKT